MLPIRWGGMLYLVSKIQLPTIDHVFSNDFMCMLVDCYWLQTKPNNDSQVQNINIVACGIIITTRVWVCGAVINQRNWWYYIIIMIFTALTIIIPIITTIIGIRTQGLYKYLLSIDYSKSGYHYHDLTFPLNLKQWQINWILNYLFLNPHYK